MNNAISSNKRVIISGDILELYDYKQPYFYNWIKGKPTIRGGSLPDSKRKDNIQRSMATIRRLIHCNQINQIEKPKFLTLTYADDIKELDIANPHFSEFTNEVRNKYGDLQYIAVPEFQPVSQRVHYHALYFNMPFVSDFKQAMLDLWPHGSTKIEAVRSMKAMPRYIGKYMTKSLGDKRTIGRKSYFSSRNLQRPIVIHDQKRATDMLEQWSSTLNELNTKQFTDYRGRDVTYHIFEGARELTANLRLVQSF
jgi:hypothetical protein